MYNILIDQGLSQEEAMKISLLFNHETKRLIEELSNLNESELHKALEDLNNKLIKSPEEVLLIDILSMDKNSARVDVVNQINDIIASSSVAAWINSKYVGKDINQFNLDIKAIDGQIIHLQQKISRSQLGKSKVNIMKSELDDLKNIRSTKISKSTKLSNVTTSVGKWAGRIAVACQVAEISTEQYENYFKNGDELDDVAVAVGIDVAEIVASGIAGSKFLGLVGSGAGPMGTVIGIVGGFFVTAVVGYFYNVFIDPILTDLYNNIIEPSSYWIKNKVNDLGDWWDTLYW